MTAKILDMNQRLQAKRDIAEALKELEQMNVELNEVDEWIAMFFNEKKAEESNGLFD